MSFEYVKVHRATVLFIFLSHIPYRYITLIHSDIPTSLIQYAHSFRYTYIHAEGSTCFLIAHSSRGPPLEGGGGGGGVVEPIFDFWLRLAVQQAVALLSTAYVRTPFLSHPHTNEVTPLSLIELLRNLTEPHRN
jgi:hypothetical protein